MTATGTEIRTPEEAPPPIAFRPGEPVLVPMPQDILTADPNQFTAKFTDIAANNLACAVGLPRTEELDIPKFLALLDKMAATARQWTEKNWRLFDLKPVEFNHSKNVYRVLTMTQVLYKHFGVHYNPERTNKDNPTDRSRLDDGDTGDSFIHGLLGPRKTGICGTMPVLAVAVGRRLGYPLHIVKLPDDMLFNWHDEHERFNVECTSQQGSEVHPDEFYHQWPTKRDAEYWAEPAPNGYRWLTAMPARFEMARFISNRTISLRHYNRHGEALDWIDALEKFHGMAYDQWRLESLGKHIRKSPISFCYTGPPVEGGPMPKRMPWPPAIPGMSKPGPCFTPPKQGSPAIEPVLPHQITGRQRPKRPNPAHLPQQNPSRNVRSPRQHPVLPLPTVPPVRTMVIQHPPFKQPPKITQLKPKKERLMTSHATHELPVDFQKAADPPKSPTIPPQKTHFDLIDTYMAPPTEPLTLNKYLYANADPVMNIDPTEIFSVTDLVSLNSIIASAFTFSVSTSKSPQLQRITWGLQQATVAAVSVADAIAGNQVALNPKNRLGKALNQSGYTWLVLYVIAFKESSFNANATNSHSSAVGLFQILVGTADDAQDRLWPNYVSKANSPVPAGQRFADYRTNPDISAEMAEVVLLDKIASHGNNLRAGIAAYGEYAQYANKVMAGIQALQQVLKIPPGANWDPIQIINAIAAQPGNVVNALDKAVH